MLLFGHRFIDSENIFHIQSIDAIQNTPPSSTLLVDFNEDNLDIIKHAAINSIPLAINVENITQIIYASSLGAAYIVLPKELAKTAQNLADNYLFDAKILVHVEQEDEIEELALLGVDGIIFSNAIIKVNS
ncbi:hypothetical protein [Sulfurimonas sp.]|uniref:hypothetical protein n=1 Tax=Sulfurimonas sp. TaxID=2022749 RepID=UPI002614177B|nr:hypothetical protein [Sulfurimonas sp.]MCW8894694.1 hypothetical protein [Sulfurimonas sp.]